MEESTGISTPKEGLSPEENGQILTSLVEGNYDALLQIIDAQEQEDDKQMACEVILSAMYDSHEIDSGDSAKKLLTTAFNNIDQYAAPLKELIFYVWANHSHGERFLENPSKKGETLFLDRDGEIISFQGEIAKDDEDRWYIKNLNDYNVLTGPLKGQVYNGHDRNNPSYRRVPLPRGVNV